MESNYCSNPTQSDRIAAQKKDFVMSLKTKFAGLMAGVVLIGTLSTRAFAKTPDNPDPIPRTEFVTKFGDVATDGAGGKGTPEPKATGDKIKINGVDMRGLGKDIKDIEDGAAVMSMRGKFVLICYMDKNDPDFEADIENAVRQQILAGRKDIYVIYTDKNPKGKSYLHGIAKGHLGNPVNSDDTEDLDVYIKRGYDEYGYKIYPVQASTSKTTTPASYNACSIAVATNE